MTTDTPVLVTFGDFIKIARLSQRLSQGEVASVAKIEQSYLSKIERGIKEPTLGVALRLCDALHLDINEFVRNRK